MPNTMLENTMVTKCFKTRKAINTKSEGKAESITAGSRGQWKM